MDGMEGMFQGLDIAASAMTAEMLRARVVSANLANMHVVGGKGHEPYRRKGVVFEELLEGGGAGLDGSRRLARGVRVGRVYEDHTTPFQPRRDPGHPWADENGFVLGSNVDMFREMVDMMAIERSFQANLAAMQAYRGMLQNSITHIGRS
jgi:flagellar basal-body rod protein FlgC